MGKTIEERAWNAAVKRMQGDSSYTVGYKEGATEQRQIDHSEEHLEWIIKEHSKWMYEQWHCDNNERCTFKKWIDDAMEE